MAQIPYYATLQVPAPISDHDVRTFGIIDVDTNTRNMKLSGNVLLDGQLVWAGDSVSGASVSMDLTTVNVSGNLVTNSQAPKMTQLQKRYINTGDLNTSMLYISQITNSSGNQVFALCIDTPTSDPGDLPWAPNPDLA